MASLPSHRRSLQICYCRLSLLRDPIDSVSIRDWRSLIEVPTFLIRVGTGPSQSAAGKNGGQAPEAPKHTGFPYPGVSQRGLTTSGLPTKPSISPSRRFSIFFIFQNKIHTNITHGRGWWWWCCCCFIDPPSHPSRRDKRHGDILPLVLPTKAGRVYGYGRREASSRAPGRIPLVAQNQQPASCTIGGPCDISSPVVAPEAPTRQQQMQGKNRGIMEN